MNPLQDLPPAIPSGTVAIIRDGDAGGVEVLMVRRPASPTDNFSGMWVFPGGKVDPADLEFDQEELGSALAAAVRETFEEVGLELTHDALHPVNRWEPEPRPNIPKRFSAWVFVAQSTNDAVQIDGVEIHDHDWVTPKEAMRRHALGEMGIAPPTWHTLLELAAHDHVGAVMTWAKNREPEHYLSRFGKVDGHLVLAWHGDELVDGLEDDRHRLWMIEGDWRYERNV